MSQDRSDSARRVGKKSKHGGSHKGGPGKGRGAAERMKASSVVKPLVDRLQAIHSGSAEAVPDSKVGLGAQT